VRFIVVTSLASGVAWVIVSVAHLPTPVVGAVGAMLSIQVTSHLSLKSGAVRAFAILVGMLVAMAGFALVGKGVLVVVGVVGVSLVVGKLLGLSADVVRTVPAMCLYSLILGRGFGVVAVSQYMAETVIGVLVGVVASAFVHRMSAPERATIAVAALSGAIATLLGELGTGASSQYTRHDAERWLRSARSIANRADDVGILVGEAQGHARWALTEKERDVTDLTTSMAVMRLSTDQIVGIARSMFDSVVQYGELGRVEGLDDALLHTATAFEVHADLGVGNASTTDLAEAVEVAREQTEAVGVELSEERNPATLVAAGSIVADLHRMVDQLEGSAEVFSLEESGPSRSEALLAPITGVWPQRWSREAREDDLDTANDEFEIR
jgi:hypothetical protein